MSIMVKETDSLQTPLHDLHVELGAKMVPFAGYRMPIQYPSGIIKEHQHTRTHAGLFDVSHMGQLILSGSHVAQQLESLVPVDLEHLKLNQQTYTLFTSASGGILDDLIITRLGSDTFFLVVNAACKGQDVVHLRNHLSPETNIELLSDRALLALQGPAAKDVMASLAPSINTLVFMQGCHATIEGIECYITRSGYTGEDGFEISLPTSEAERIARLLLSYEEVEPIGLGARDSLRLEAGLCLYGHDMDCNTSIAEASLLWSISKSRLPQGEKAGGFRGAEALFSQLQDGISRKRVGLVVDGRVPVREGAELVNKANEYVGTITSGGFAPTLKVPVALGYVDIHSTAIGTQLFAQVRGKQIPVTVSNTPFVPQRYYRKKS